MDMTPVSVKRVNSEHDSDLHNDGICSAFYLREQVLSNDIGRLKDFVPQSAYELYMDEIKSGKAPMSLKDVQKIALYKLRSMNKDDFAALNDVSEGLENRLYDAAQKACSIDEFLTLVKTKRYTLARLRRILMCALLDIKKADKDFSLPYIRVLGMNQKGKEVLANARSEDTLITPKFANIYKLNTRLAQIDKSATDFTALLQEGIQPSGLDFTENVIIV